MAIELPPLTISQTRMQSTAAIIRTDSLLEKAREFEAIFIAQVLNYSGLAKAIRSGGGFGGDAFSGMMLEQYANKMVENGGFGLTEQIYRQLLEREVSNEKNSSA